MVTLMALAQSVTRTNVPTPPLTFAWDVSTDSTVDSYKLWQGLVSRSYSNSVWTPNTNQFTWSGNFQRGIPLYFNITAEVSTNGLESDFATNEVSYQFPALPPAPQGVTAVAN